LNPRDISVVVTTYNEADNIARCLDSLDGFGEIVVVDSFSSDDTVAIVRRYPTTLYSRAYRSAADQKNWALGVVKNDWVLILDADEVLTGDLRAEIERLQPSAHAGYWLRRSSVYLGRRIRGCGWQRDKVLRLFDRRRGRYDDVSVHEEVSLDGPVDRLTHPLLHYPYRDLRQHIEKINEYSSRGARDYVDRGGRLALLNMLVHPPFRLLRMYLLQLGIRDGREGVILCLLSAYSVLLKYAKAWELTWNRR
jgi:glycosyltransferase involved in cell wall biosynthesis